jgi:hypothetical protein
MSETTKRKERWIVTAPRVRRVCHCVTEHRTLIAATDEAKRRIYGPVQIWRLVATYHRELHQRGKKETRRG